MSPVSVCGCCPKTEPQKINVQADIQFCCKDGPLFDEKWVVNKKNKGLRISLVDGETFTQHYVSALRDRPCRP